MLIFLPVKWTWLSFPAFFNPLGPHLIVSEHIASVFASWFSFGITGHTQIPKSFPILHQQWKDGDKRMGMERRGIVNWIVSVCSYPVMWFLFKCIVSYWVRAMSQCLTGEILTGDLKTLAKWMDKSLWRLTTDLCESPSQNQDLNSLFLTQGRLNFEDWWWMQSDASRIKVRKETERKATRTLSIGRWETNICPLR